MKKKNIYYFNKLLIYFLAEDDFLLPAFFLGDFLLGDFLFGADRLSIDLNLLAILVLLETFFILDPVFGLDGRFPPTVFLFLLLFGAAAELTVFGFFLLLLAPPLQPPVLGFLLFLVDVDLADLLLLLFGAAVLFPASVDFLLLFAPPEHPPVLLLLLDEEAGLLLTLDDFFLETDDLFLLLPPLLDTFLLLLGASALEDLDLLFLLLGASALEDLDLLLLPPFFFRAELFFLRWPDFLLGADSAVEGFFLLLLAPPSHPPVLFFRLVAVVDEGLFLCLLFFVDEELLFGLNADDRRLLFAPPIDVLIASLSTSAPTFFAAFNPSVAACLPTLYSPVATGETSG